MANKSFNRTVEEINPLLDKIDNDYSKSEIDGLISAINNDKMSKSSIVKLDSMADFESITDKTAEWYFIKEG